MHNIILVIKAQGYPARGRRFELEGPVIIMRGPIDLHIFYRNGGSATIHHQ